MKIKGFDGLITKRSLTHSYGGYAKRDAILAKANLRASFIPAMKRDGNEKGEMEFSLPLAEANGLLEC